MVGQRKRLLSSLIIFGEAAEALLLFSFFVTHPPGLGISSFQLPETWVRNRIK
jgi:hypothetical protein